MTRVHLGAGVTSAIEHSPAVVAACAALAGRIAGAVRAQGIKVGDVDGGKHEIDLPMKVLRGPSVSTPLVHDERGVVPALGAKGPKTLVVIAHPSGKAVQAKHGALTRAAAAVGRTVRS